MRQKQRGPGGSRRSAEPGLNFCTPAQRSGSGNITAKLRTQALDDLLFQRAISRLHRLDPRILLELLAEIGRERLLRNYLERKIDRYLALPGTALDLTGARDFPPQPIRLVP